MRHQKTRSRLKQKPAHARMIKRNLITSLLLYESVRTTKKRAQVIQPVIDKLINVAKTRPPHSAIRFINRTVTDKNASRKVMEVFKDRYSDRSSGLTRMVPVGSRSGDGAEIVDLSLMDSESAIDDRKTEPPSLKLRRSRKGKGKRENVDTDDSPLPDKKTSAKKES